MFSKLLYDSEGKAENLGISFVYLFRSRASVPFIIVLVAFLESKKTDIWRNISNIYLALTPFFLI
jgi:hypothetical protein